MNKSENESVKWRQSSRDEIAEYYSTEFPTRIDELPSWVTPNGPRQYALAFRDKYPAQYGKGNEVPPKNFIRRSTRDDDNNTKNIQDWDALLSFLQQPASKDPLSLQTDGAKGLINPDEERVSEPEPVPEAVYYSLDHWEQFWVLAFDIDAKDVAKQSIAGGNQSYSDVSKEQVVNSGIISEPPVPHTLPPQSVSGEENKESRTQEYEYRFEDIEKTLHYAFELKKWLQETVGFTDVRVFYSGQGAHVYAFDDDPYYQFTHQSRRFLTTYIRERLRIPIDQAVTWDRQRVMRLPGSLHTSVNRVVTEIQSPDFDFKNNAVAKTNKELDSKGVL